MATAVVPVGSLGKVALWALVAAVFAPSQLAARRGLAVAQSVQESLVLPLLTGAGLEEVVMLSDLLQVAARAVETQELAVALAAPVVCSPMALPGLPHQASAALPAIHQGMTSLRLALAVMMAAVQMVSLLAVQERP